MRSPILDPWSSKIALLVCCFILGIEIRNLPCAAQTATGQVASRSNQSADTVYFQQLHVPHTEKQGLVSERALCVASDGDHILIGTDQGILRYDRNLGWKTLVSSSEPIVCLSAAPKLPLVFATSKNVAMFDGEAHLTSLGNLPDGVVPTCLGRSAEKIWLGSKQGLYVYEDDRWIVVEAVHKLLEDELEIRQITTDRSEVSIAAQGGLLAYDPSKQIASRITPQQGAIGWWLKDVRGVDHDDQGQLWFAAPQGCGVRTQSGWRLFDRGELPWNDFTCLSAGDAASGVWFGTNKGAVHYDGNVWEYRQGPRWLRDDRINGLAIHGPDCWIATAKGVSQIQTIPMTLTDKSDRFNDTIDRLHKRTSYGYVDAVTLQHPDDDSSVQQHDSDNDGLWTSMYGAAQCFEYAATRSEPSKQRARQAWKAIAFLSEVPQGGGFSPPRGFPARSILPVSGFDPNTRDNEVSDRRRLEWDPLWKILTPRWPKSRDGQWYWKTDTSSDELDGHFFFYSLYHDLVAETDDEKRSVIAVVDRVTTHLLENGYCLVDHDGKPTRWGQFAPEVINTDKLTDCRGLNSISILSYLLVAEHITGNPKYRNAYEKLMNDHHYFTNILTPKFQNGPGSGNQSDDEMAFMCYYTALRYESDPKYRKQWMRSMGRYFAQELPEACPLFNYVFAKFWEPVPYYWQEVPQEILVDALDTLRRFPLDRRQWAFENSHRLDIAPLGDHILLSKERGSLKRGKVVPIDERNINHWNQDPWRLDGNGNGLELADGTSFLLPYWMGVYLGFIQR